MRGFIGGLAIGLVTVAIAVVGLSLLSPTNPGPVVSVGAPQSVTEPASGELGTQSEPGVSGAGADADLVELPPANLESQEAGNDDQSPADTADTDPGDKPSVGGATTGLADQGNVPQAPGVDVSGDSPVAPSSPSDAPGTPENESQPRAVANPAQPALPDVSQGGSGFGTGPQIDETSPEVTTTTDPAPSSAGSGVVAAAPVAEQTPDPSTQPAAAPQTATGQAETPPANTEQATEPSTQPVAEPKIAADQTETPPADTDPAAGVTPVPDVGQAAPKEPEEPTEPQIAALPQAGDDSATSGPSIGKPVVPLTQRDKASDPQPQVAGTEAGTEADTGAESGAESGADTGAAAPAGPPIKANAEAFDNPDDRPLMSIVLIDDADGIGAEALADFPYPLSFAVNPTDPDAAEKMARHRAAGFEVVALVDLPDDATAQDAEVNLSVWLGDLPQVVALMEGTGTGIQGNRDLSDHVTAIVSDRELGLIMQSRGLNTAFKLAARDNVPAALVFRDFDGAGQTPAVMRRFLDQAAFRAGQQGGVIMLGRLRPDTISALLLWGLQDRASRVALAPVSAILTR